MKSKEVCRECGRSVARGSGWFINRVVDLDAGTYLCSECADKLYNRDFEDEFEDWEDDEDEQ